MNIFVLDTDPCIAAQFMCNKHVNKLFIESVQLSSQFDIIHKAPCHLPRPEGRGLRNRQTNVFRHLLTFRRFYQVDVVTNIHTFL